MTEHHYRETQAVTFISLILLVVWFQSLQQYVKEHRRYLCIGLFLTLVGAQFEVKNKVILLKFNHEWGGGDRTSFKLAIEVDIYTQSLKEIPTHIKNFVFTER